MIRWGAWWVTALLFVLGGGVACSSSSSSNSDSTSDGSGGTGQNTPAELECADTSECTSGARCVANAMSSLGGVCADECSTNSGCRSNCCAPLDDGATSVCSPAEFCACLEAGSECTGNPSGCCSDSICVDSILEPGVAHCAATCSSATECNSNCCAGLSNATAGVCAPEDECTCTEAGFECADTMECCTGNRCVEDPNSSAGGYCAAECTDDAECTSGCCALLDDGVTRVCSPAEFCTSTPGTGGGSPGAGGGSPGQ